MYEMRDAVAVRSGMQLIVHQNPDAVARGINPFDHGGLHTDLVENRRTEAGPESNTASTPRSAGARRDEEKSRAKERIFSFRSANQRWDPKNQRPELWNIYNSRKNKGESIRVFRSPIGRNSISGSTSILRTSRSCRCILPRHGRRSSAMVCCSWSMMNAFGCAPGEIPVQRSIRFRTLGCYPLTGAVESSAATVPEIIQEMLLTTTSERQGRAIDHDQGASMELKKQAGYF